MSSKKQVVDVCASCGVKEDVDNMKLKTCTGCNLTKYCSVDCQNYHRLTHEKACQKRAAEIRADQLFKQSDISHLGECQICFLSLPLDMKKWRMKPCCSTRVCLGCSYANTVREIEASLEHSCPFCRHPDSKTQEEAEKTSMKRAKANDPTAICQMGTRCYHKGDYDSAFQYWTKAVRLGDIEAHYQLSCLYHNGNGVEIDKKKVIHHLEEAAIGGHPKARYNLALAVGKGKDGNIKKAIKHWIIAANLGYDDALKALNEAYDHGDVTKEDYDSAVHGHQAALDATKSEKRTEAYAYYNVDNS